MAVDDEVLARTFQRAGESPMATVVAQEVLYGFGRGQFIDGNEFKTRFGG